ncbi:MAG: serine/threonine-protein kinase [Candidatus Xenobia bacterium]
MQAVSGAVPETVGNYQVVGVLGKGAFSVVYRAQDQRDGSMAAVKLLLGFDAGSAEQQLRFEREVEIARRMTHPNLVRALDHGEEGTVPYCAMELVEGPSLRSILQQRPPGPATTEWRTRVHKLGTPLFDALQYVHNQRVIHRDIKPENVFVEAGDVPRLGDFGLAFAPSAQAQRSVAGTVVGTIAYMAPELFSGQDADRRSDIYSLGVLLLELIAGCLPWERSDLARIMAAATSSGPLPLRTLDPTAPPLLERVLKRMTAPSPEDRYFTVAEAYHDWIAALQEFTPVATHNVVELTVSSYTLMEPAFAGRELEMTWLDKSQPRRPACQVVLVSGDAGIGKSRLINEWLRKLEQTPCLEGRCTPDRAAPYQPFLPPLARAIGSVGTDRNLSNRTQDNLSALSTWLRPEVLEPVKSLVSGYLSAAVVARRNLDNVPTADRIRLYEGARRVLMHLARGPRPLVMVLEDVHAIDPASLDLLEYLAQQWWFSPDAERTGERALVVLTVRPQDVASNLGIRDWLAAHQAKIPVLDLERLETTALETMARTALGLRDRPLPEGLSAAVVEASDGNPFVLRQALHGFLNDGLLTLDAGQWVWHADRICLLPEKGVRNRLRDAVEHRLKGLSPEELAICEVMAAGREPCSLEQVATVAGRSEREVLDLLERLVSQQILGTHREAQTRWSHRNQIFADTVMERTRQERRLALYRDWIEVLVAELEASGPNAPTPLLFRLTEFCQKADDWSRSTRYLMETAERCASACDWAQAYDHYRRLLAHDHEPGVERRNRLRIRCAELAASAGEYEEAIGLFRERLRDEHKPQARAKLLHLMARTYFDKGEFVRALEGWQEALHGLGLAVPRAGARGLVAAARAAAGAYAKVFADHRLVDDAAMADSLVEVCDGIVHANYFTADPAHQNLTLYAIAAMRQVAQATGRPELLARAEVLWQYVPTVMNPPRPGDLQIAINYAEKVPDRPLLIQVLRDVSYITALAGHPERGMELSRRGETIARQVADMNGVCWHLHVGSFILRWLGDLEEVERRLRECLQIAQVIRHRRLSLAARIDLAYLVWLRGRNEEAWHLLEHAGEAELPNPFDGTLERLYRGWLLLDDGEFAEARELLAEAMKSTQRLKSGTLWTLLAAQGLGLACAELKDRSALHHLVGQCRKMTGNLDLLTCRVDLLAAELAALEGSPEQALRQFRQTAEKCQARHFLPDLARTRERAYRFCERQQLPEAASWLREAIDAWTAAGATGRAAKLR